MLLAVPLNRCRLRIGLLAWVRLLGMGVLDHIHVLLLPLRLFVPVPYCHRRVTFYNG